MALGFLVDGGIGGTRLPCGLRSRWHLAFMWREGQVAPGFHSEGGAGGIRLPRGGKEVALGFHVDCGGKGRWH